MSAIDLLDIAFAILFVALCSLAAFFAGRISVGRALRRAAEATGQPLDSSAFRAYETLEVAAGRWHRCPIGNRVRPTTALDCTQCHGTPPVTRHCADCGDVVPDPRTGRARGCSHPTRRHSYERLADGAA